MNRERPQCRAAIVSGASRRSLSLGDGTGRALNLLPSASPMGVSCTVTDLQLRQLRLMVDQDEFAGVSRVTGPKARAITLEYWKMLNLASDQCSGINHAQLGRVMSKCDSMTSNPRPWPPSPTYPISPDGERGYGMEDG